MAEQSQEITNGIHLITEQRQAPVPHFVYSVDNRRGISNVQSNAAEPTFTNPDPSCPSDGERSFVEVAAESLPA